MDKIRDCTQKLIRAILESEEYMQYCEIRDKVRENPELRRKINDFRLHVFEVQNSEEPLDMYEEQERLCREYEEFRKNPVVNDYLQAELRICRTLQKITADIAEAIDLDAQDIAERIGLQL